MSKLRVKRGDSLIEVLIAMFIAVMGAALMVTMITSAVSVDVTADGAAKSFYDDLGTAELRLSDSPTAGRVNMLRLNARNENPVGTPVSIDVNYYGGGDGFAWYIKE